MWLDAGQSQLLFVPLSKVREEERIDPLAQIQAEFNKGLSFVVTEMSPVCVDNKFLSCQYESSQ